MNRSRRGFTLVEMLVVICIVLVLLAFVTVFIPYVRTRGQVAKTVVLVQTLTNACQSYHTDYGKYPPKDAGGNSKSLHKYLGGPRKVIVAYSKSGPNITKDAPPYIAFDLTMLEEGRADVFPGSNPSEIIDGFGRPIRYEEKGKNNPKGVDIWSLGDDEGDAEDDINNWTKDY